MYQVDELDYFSSQQRSEDTTIYMGAALDCDARPPPMTVPWAQASKVGICSHLRHRCRRIRHHAVYVLQGNQQYRRG